MKTCMVLILSLLILPHVSSQQKGFDAGILFTLKGIGLNGQSGEFWNSPNGPEGRGHGGFTAGLIVKRKHSEKFYSLLEFRYSSKGSIFIFNNQYGNHSHQLLYLKYLELPFLLGYTIGTPKRKIYIETGLAYAKLINSKIKTDNLSVMQDRPNLGRVKNDDLVWIGSLKSPILRKWSQSLLLGTTITHSVLSIHKDFNLYNFDYGFELNYMF